MQMHFLRGVYLAILTASIIRFVYFNGLLVGLWFLIPGTMFFLLPLLEKGLGDSRGYFIPIWAILVYWYSFPVPNKIFMPNFLIFFFLLTTSYFIAESFGKKKAVLIV